MDDDFVEDDYIAEPDSSCGFNADSHFRGDDGSDDDDEEAEEEDYVSIADTQLETLSQGWTVERYRVRRVTRPRCRGRLLWSAIDQDAAPTTESYVEVSYVRFKLSRNVPLFGVATGSTWALHRGEAYTARRKACPRPLERYRGSRSCDQRNSSTGACSPACSAVGHSAGDGHRRHCGCTLAAFSPAVG
jgi:hypothetical protein